MENFNEYYEYDMPHRTQSQRPQPQQLQFRGAQGFPRPRQDTRAPSRSKPRQNQLGPRSRPLPQGNIRPPKQEPVLPRGGGPPKPRNLSTVATPPKNDPLHMEALLPNPGQESRPIAKELVMYPGFFALPAISNECHRTLTATDTSASRKIPQAAFAYYGAVLATARLFKVLKMAGRPVTPEEEAFMDLVYNGNYQPPEPIAYYLRGFGNVRLPNQREARFRARPRPTVRSADDSIGWFGKVGPDTHFLYAAYPCLAVYVRRIQEDFNLTEDPNMDENWNLPDDMRPAGARAGIPTSNMLGWAPANKLTAQQIQWYRNAGFTADFSFTSAHNTIPFIPELMNAIQTEINCAFDDASFIEYIPYANYLLAGSS